MATSASPAPTTPVSGELCPANIGPGERRKRLVVGLAGLGVCALATLLLIMDGAPRWWRLILILPWWTAALGIFQARSHVCVALASRGLRNLGGTQERQPAAELALVRREARRVHLRALLAAVLLTLVSIAWP